MRKEMFAVYNYVTMHFKITVMTFEVCMGNIKLKPGCIDQAIAKSISVKVEVWSSRPLLSRKKPNIFLLLLGPRRRVEVSVLFFGFVVGQRMRYYACEISLNCVLETRCQKKINTCCIS